MGYEALVRKSWRSGDFALKSLEGAGEGSCENAAALASGIWNKVCAQIEEIIEREAGDATSCLLADREGIMKLAPFVKFREEKFGAVLFETRSEKVYTLSPTGAAVVREVLTGVDAKTLMENLKSKYEDSSGKMEKEAQEFLSQLKGKGLLAE